MPKQCYGTMQKPQTFFPVRPACPVRPIPPVTLPETPMRHYCNPIPLGGSCRCETLLPTLEQQNSLLLELLASVRGLTAAVLAEKQR